MNAMSRLTSRSSVIVNSVKSRSFNTAAAAAIPIHEFPQFTSGVEIARYADAEVPSMEPVTLAKFLRYANTQAGRVPDGRDFRSSPSFRNAVSQAVRAANSQDELAVGRLMKAVADTAPSGFLPSHYKDAGDAFLRLVITRKVPLTAMNITDVLYALCKLDAKDLQLCSFIKEELPKHIPSMTPGACRGIMRVLFMMNVRDNELNRMVADKMMESVDQFKNSDVIGSLATFAYCNYTVGPIVKRCIELLSEHTSLFDAEELVHASEALLQLQSFSPRVAMPVLEELQKRVRSLRTQELGQLLNILSAAPRVDAQFANEVVGILASSAVPKYTATEASMAHAICTFNLVERKPLLQTLINDLLGLDTIKPHLMTKLIEIVESAKHDMDMKVNIPDRFNSQLEEFYGKQKVSGFAYMAKEFIEKLPEKFRLSVETGVRVGPFTPTLVDTKNKVVIEVSSDATPLRLRRHLYEKLGYSAVNLQAKMLRTIKDEGAKLEYIQAILGPAYVNLGRMTMDELSALRDQRNNRQ